jgi:hypothetical protein
LSGLGNVDRAGERRRVVRDRRIDLSGIGDEGDVHARKSFLEPLLTGLLFIVSLDRPGRRRGGLFSGPRTFVEKDETYRS